MKFIKIILASIIILSYSFSYSQSLDDLGKDNWRESSVRNFYNQLDRPLKNIEGIFSGTFQGTYYKIAIFYFDNEDYYEGRILETSSKNKNWQIGDKKIVLEELGSPYKGNFDVKWYHPAKRNKKNEIIIETIPVNEKIVIKQKKVSGISRKDNQQKCYNIPVWENAYDKSLKLKKINK